MIEQKARRLGDSGRLVWFEESASGRKLDRPVLSDLRGRARLGEFKRLYVYKLDRLTRSGIRDTLNLIQEFEGQGMQVVTVADPFELNTPFAPLILSVLAWAAEQERRVIGDRIHDARKRVEAAGGNWGRPRQSISRTDLFRAERMRREGVPLRRVAATLGVPCSTLARILSQKPPVVSTEITPGSPTVAKCRPKSVLLGQEEDE